MYQQKDKEGKYNKNQKRKGQIKNKLKMRMISKLNNLEYEIEIQNDDEQNQTRKQKQNNYQQKYNQPLNFNNKFIHNEKKQIKFLLLLFINQRVLQNFNSQKFSKNDKSKQKDKLQVNQMKAIIHSFIMVDGDIKNDRIILHNRFNQINFIHKEIIIIKSFIQDNNKFQYIYFWFKYNKNQTFIILLNSIIFLYKITSILKVLGVLCYFEVLIIIQIKINTIIKK
ncbi:unnamed protein product [Paramecium pentaurelia]|uniref:Transmembrane protein n=1 Tax=Paramecium pentaurelia TaxID=43138 RepID=A0A8S1W943_9CILI|nr:unnamed protein product [Paramecium pentaurelia]